uniref:RING-CH-type domain-containing protein n=1 Tax=Acrobeloides nanus TaxID=290746 RepID=A0A914CCU3_9BILA
MNEDENKPVNFSSDNEEEEENERICKICYGVDNLPDEEWLAPCKCSGTIKWVHRHCLTRWLQNAPYVQQEQCNACKYFYKKRFSVKALRDWTVPNLRLRFLDVCEIALEIWSTISLIRGIMKTFQGRRTAVRSLLHFFVWKGFVAHERRIMFYKGMGYSLINSAIEPIVLNAD